MNYRISTYAFKKYSLYVLSVFIITAMLVCGGEFYFGSLYGDLTRIGSLPERDFSGQMNQPEVQAKYLHSYPITESDALIIGDSFSVSLVWQSQLALAGIKASTLQWEDVSLCLEDFGEVVRQSGFGGRYVIIESVERALQDKLHSRCRKGSKFEKSSDYSRSPPLVNESRFSLTGSRLGAKWVIEAMANKFRYTYRPSSFMEFGNTRMVETGNGCSLFTNRLCNYGLYFADDFKKGAFTSIDNALSINRSLEKAGMQAIWLVVPDKSTVYLGYGNHVVNTYINPWNVMRENGELKTPDLGEMFIRQSRLFNDFYAPNNTHLSPSGYLYLGDLVLDYIQKLKQADKTLAP